MYVSRLLAPDQPVYNILQLLSESRAPCQENFPAGLFVFLHSRQDETGWSSLSLPHIPLVWTWCCLWWSLSISLKVAVQVKFMLGVLIPSLSLQEHRNRVFHDFRNGLCRNLVCTGEEHAHLDCFFFFFPSISFLLAAIVIKVKHVWRMPGAVSLNDHTATVVTWLACCVLSSRRFSGCPKTFCRSNICF